MFTCEKFSSELKDQIETKKTLDLTLDFIVQKTLKNKCLAVKKTKRVMTKVYPRHFFASVDQFRKFSTSYCSHTFEVACDRDVLRVKVTPYRRFPEG